MVKNISISLIIWSMTYLVSCNKHANTSQKPILNVNTSPAQEQLISKKMEFASSAEPLYSVTIEPRVNGYLEQINFLSGEPIKRGDTIFKIDPSLLNTTYYSALASYESAKANYIEAKNNHDRAIPLSKINAISKSELDEYIANFAAAKSNVKSAEESVINSEYYLSYSHIKAPIDGIISDTPAAIGDYVGPNSEFPTLTTISNIDTLKFPIAIPTSVYLKYSNSSSSFDNKSLLSQITLILADSSEYPLKASYDYTQKNISKSSSTIVIYAKVANPSLVLKPNMFIRVHANIGDAQPCITVPQRSVMQLQGINSVWVIGADSTASYRAVELGDTVGEDWIITSGLEAGERVATSAQLKLHEGMKVKPIENKK